MKRLSAVLFVLLLVSMSQAQQRWTRTYGGTGTDWGYSVQQTSDGGYVVAGATGSFGNGAQAYLIKTNASGDTLWTKAYGGASDEWGESVQQTSDSGYIVAGHTTSTGTQVYLIKTNASGDTLWTRTYGGARDEMGHSVQQTSDLGYIVAGDSGTYGNPQVYLIKTDASGDTLWTKTYGGTGSEWGYSVQQTSDGGYIIAGNTNSFGAGINDVYLIKTNAFGDTLWTRTYGGTSYDEGNSVQQTSDGGYIVAGVSSSFGNGYQVYLIKTNASGDTLWTKTYGGTGSEFGNSVQQTSDMGFIIAGWTDSYGSGRQVYLIKTNALGDTLWTRTFGGATDEDGWSVQKAADGGYIIAGRYDAFGTNPQVYLIKTDANGNVGVEDDSPGRIIPLTSNLSSSVVPNPFTSFATVPGHEGELFALYDISGRRVGVYKGDRIGEGLRAGVYFIRTLEGKAGLVRIVKIR